MSDRSPPERRRDWRTRLFGRARGAGVAGVGAVVLVGLGALWVVPAMRPWVGSPTQTSPVAPDSNEPSPDAPPFNILVLDGADPARPAAQELMREFALALNQAPGRRVELFQENLDRRRFDDATHLQRAQDWFVSKYRSIPLDAIVSIDSVPTDAALRLRATLQRPIPIIAGFTSGHSEGQVATLRRLPRVSIVRVGALEDTLIRHIATLFPQTRSIVVVTDNNATADHLRGAIRRVSGGSIAAQSLVQLRMSALRDSLAALPEDAAVLYWSISRDGDGNSWIPSEALRAIAGSSARPIFGAVDLLVGVGSFGGPSLSYGALGRALSDQTRAVLRRQTGADRAIITHTDWRWRYDWSLVQRYDVPASRLHAPADLVGRSRPFWVSHPIQTGVVAVLLLLQLVTIVALMRRNRYLVAARTELRMMSEDLIQTQDDERRRIARDLDDDLSQQLSLLAIDLEASRATDTSALAMRVQGLVHRTQEIARGLHPGTVALRDLRHAVETLVRPIGTSHGLLVDVQARAWPPSLAPEVTLGLFRIVQEALRNVVRHANATRCSIQLSGEADMLKVVVRDDGVGLPQGPARPRGLGLLSMKERARAMGGVVYVSSEPLRGTAIVVLIPKRPE